MKLRTLRLTSPLAHGEDVRALQQGINRVHRKHPLAPQVTADGEYGPQTSAAARSCAYLLGVGIKEGGLRPYVQRLIKHPQWRTPLQRRRSSRRFKRLRKSGQGGGAVLRWCKQQVGTTESPYGSNRGPKVSKWERDFGMDGQPWCGAFVGYALRHIGGLAIGGGVVYTPNIISYAKTGTGGFISWHSWQDRQPGDLVLYKWPGISRAPCDHVGILDSDKTHTIEGNTSSGNAGSQNNGGGVYRRDRGPGNVVGVARPRWH